MIIKNLKNTNGKDEIIKKLKIEFTELFDTLKKNPKIEKEKEILQNYENI